MIYFLSALWSLYMSENVVMNPVPVNPNPQAGTPAFNPIDWWMKNKRWIFPTILFVVGYFGGNPDNVAKWMPDFPAGGNTTEVVERLGRIESHIETLVKVVGEHDKLLNPTNVGEKPVYRE